MKKTLSLIFIISVGAIFCLPVQIDPDSLNDVLSADSTDSSLIIRAEIAYARGLYQASRDLLDRVKNPGQREILLRGQCSHILAESQRAMADFRLITDPDFQPMAILGIAELFCGDLPDPDSCARYSRLIAQMDYLKRFVELEIPKKGMPADKNVVKEPNDSIPDGWTLQFGAFSMRSLAEKLSEKVRKEGLYSWIDEEAGEDGILYLVFGGNFSTKNEASARADALAKEFTCKVVEYKK
jgi:hypothetical protein